MRVTVGDTKLFFDVEGASLVPDGPRMRQKPTLLLLHGGPGSDHSDYKPYLSQLANYAQIVYLDHRGVGRSDRSDPASWNLRRWAVDVRDFCDALEIERPVILGSSFGGFVALRYAIDYPDHLSKLILLVTAARMDIERLCEAVARFGGDAQRAATERFFTDPTMENQDGFVEACGPLYSVQPPDCDVAARAIKRPEVTHHFFRQEGMAFDHREGAARVKCPVLVISGAQDPITPVEAGLELAQSLPSDLVEFVTIENAAHELLLDASDQVVPLLRRFIAT